MRDASSSSVRIVFPAFSREELVRRLRVGISCLQDSLPVERAVLFGSWAAGRATAYSDIDLLVVYSGRECREAYDLVRGAIPLRGLEPHVYSHEQAAGVCNVLERMTREGIDLMEDSREASEDRS